MPFTHYTQYDAMDCGPTCLRMVARHYGKHIAAEKLRTEAQIGKEGVSLLGLSDAAEKIGFRTQGVKISLNDLVHDVPLPAILHWGQSHFIVLYKVKNQKLYIADPAAGLFILTIEEFKRKWISDKNSGIETGVALLLEPTVKFYNQEEQKETAGLRFKNLIRYITPYKGWAFQLILGMGIASLLQLGLPFLTRSVVDIGVNTGNVRFVFLVLIAQAALLAGRMVVEFVRSWILLFISTRINISILTDFLIKLMKLPIGFFDSKHTGDIMQRMNDHQRIETFLTGSSLNTFFSLFNLVVYSVVLLFFNASIFFVFLVASILYSFWVIVFLKRRKALDYKHFDIAAREQGITIQLVQGMQEIKLHGCEKPMRWSWERLQARLFKLSIKSMNLNLWQQSGAFFINEGKNILATFLSARAAIRGEITLGDMLAIQYIIGQLNSPIEQLIAFVQSWQNAKISLDRLNEIHKLEDEEPAGKPFIRELPAAFRKQLVGGKHHQSHENYDPEAMMRPGNNDRFSSGNPSSQPADTTASINFRNVWFTYTGAGNEPVLRNINLQIPEGKTTAIVGVSGSGKTTLLKLLLKFYEPQQGEIRLGNTPFSEMSHAVWRKHCGVVMQDSFIFNDSIARNISIGEEAVDMKRLQHALRVANIDEFVESLPLGLNTRIGTEGTGVSMGQKQRILIARAVYRDPRFLFFDEATNSLDANNESIIIQNLESFFKGRTVLVVAHRLSTVKHADQIVVLKAGEIAECGTHQELIHMKGEYYTLVKNQLELGN